MINSTIPWIPTHVMKRGKTAPIRLMLNSGCFFSKKEWEQCLEPSITVWDDMSTRDSNGDLVNVKVLLSNGFGSTTPLNRPVKRATRTEMSFRGKRRRLIVTLLPGDLIELRPEGCRERRQLPLSDVWNRAGRLQMLAASKASKRRSRKGSI